jgi:hypothetical protein
MTDTNDRPGPAEVPIPPEARDHAVDVLARRFASDQLSEEQLEALLDRVYGAGTMAELDDLIANLPVRQAGGEEGGSMDVAVAGSSALEPQPVRIRSVLSGQERRITGVVPRRLELRARLGYVELDLTDATFEPGVTEIDARALMGYVQIRLPADVQIDNEGAAILGFFALKGAGLGAAADTGRTVRVTGRAIMGFAECLVTGAGRESGKRRPG